MKHLSLLVLLVLLLCGCAIRYVAIPGAPTAHVAFTVPPNTHEAANVMRDTDIDCENLQRIGTVGNYGVNNNPRIDLDITANQKFTVYLGENQMTSNGFALGMASCSHTFSFMPEQDLDYQIEIVRCRGTVYRMDASAPGGRVIEPSAFTEPKQCPY